MQHRDPNENNQMEFGEEHKEKNEGEDKPFNAEETWRAFNSKFVLDGFARKRDESKIKYSYPKVSKRKKKTEADPTKDADFYALRLQRRWKDLRQSKIARANVSPKGHHSEAFTYFLHSEPIKKSLNKNKIEQFDNALRKGDPNDPIFQDEELPHIVVAWFGAQLPDEKSTLSIHIQQQACTALERYVFLNEIKEGVKIYEPRGNYSILDDKGNFTQEAKRILLPAISKNQNLGLFDEKKQEEFRQLVLALPASERVFYTSSMGLVGKLHTLGNLYYAAGVIYSHDEKELVHLSAGSRDALGIARHGLNEYVRVVTRLGEQTLAEIEAGMVFSQRAATLLFPGAGFNRNIHGSDFVSALESWYHDYYHSILMSLIPNIMVQSLSLTIGLIRNATNITWSKETWTLTDAELNFLLSSDEATNYHYLNSKSEENSSPTLSKKSEAYPPYFSKIFQGQALNAQENTDLFCRMLSFGRTNVDVAAQGSYLFLANQKISTAGIIVLMDMARNPDAWSEAKINPEYLRSPFIEYYKRIKFIVEFVPEHIDIKLQIFFCQIAFYLREIGQEAYLKPIIQMLLQDESLAKRLLFKKIGKSASEEDKNYAELIVAKNVKLADFLNLITLNLDGKFVCENTIGEFIKEYLAKAKAASREPVHKQRSLSNLSTFDQSAIRLKSTQSVPVFFPDKKHKTNSSDPSRSPAPSPAPSPSLSISPSISISPSTSMSQSISVGSLLENDPELAERYRGKVSTSTSFTYSSSMPTSFFTTLSTSPTSLTPSSSKDEGGPMRIRSSRSKSLIGTPDTSSSFETQTQASSNLNPSLNLNNASTLNVNPSPTTSTTPVNTTKKTDDNSTGEQDRPDMTLK